MVVTVRVLPQVIYYVIGFCCSNFIHVYLCVCVCVKYIHFNKCESAKHAASSYLYHQSLSDPLRKEKLLTLNQVLKHGTSCNGNCHHRLLKFDNFLKISLNFSLKSFSLYYCYCRLIESVTSIV